MNHRHAATDERFQADWNKGKKEIICYITNIYGPEVATLNTIDPNNVTNVSAESPIPLTVERKRSRVSKEGEDGDGLPHGVESIKAQIVHNTLS